MSVTRAGQQARTARNWGGRREGAGRPRRSRETIAHSTRPKHFRDYPLHVTLHVRKGVPTLRGSKLFRRIRGAFIKARNRFGMTLAHYSVQGNHVHLIVEANDRRALSRGIQGLAVRIAKAVNRVHGRRGSVFSERYYARPLRTALQVKRALIYVLFNERHHLAQRGLSLPCWWLDPCSSIRELPQLGWHSELPSPRLLPPTSTSPPRFYLLRTAWKRFGTIRFDDAPASVKHIKRSAAPLPLSLAA